MRWWQELLLALIGTPILLLALMLIGGATVAPFDAISAFRGSDRIRKLMARRWPE